MQLGVSTNRNSRPISGYRSLTAAVRATTATVPCAVYRTDGHASANLCLSQPAWTTTTKRREENLFVRSGKSEAEVTNNRRLRSTYCTIEAYHLQTRSNARPLCDSSATCPGDGRDSSFVPLFVYSTSTYTSVRLTVCWWFACSFYVRR